MEIQTRSEETGLRHWESLEDAINYAKEDGTVWKISFGLSNGERVRLIRDGDNWVYRPIVDELKAYSDRLQQALDEAKSEE